MGIRYAIDELACHRFVVSAKMISHEGGNQRGWVVLTHQGSGLALHGNVELRENQGSKGRSFDQPKRRTAAWFKLCDPAPGRGSEGLLDGEASTRFSIGLCTHR